jgi:hypothetical protein
VSSSTKAIRQARDADIARLNGVGLSLTTVGYLLGVHPTTVHSRLLAIGMVPADTRRSFMEDIYKRLSPAQKSWLENQVGPHITVKDLVTSLLVRAFLSQQPSAPTGDPDAT